VGLALAASPGGWALASDYVESSYYIDTKDRAVVRRLVEKFDLEERRGDGYEVVIPATLGPDLLREFPAAKLVEADTRVARRQWEQQHPNWKRDGGYHDFDSVQSELKTMVSTYPQLASLENYGNSNEGRPLTALRLTAWNGDPKPELMITAATHGNEPAPVEILMAVIEQLVKGYGSDARLTKMLDKHVLYFIPVVSPDGYVANTRYTNGVDPNRDYPYPDDPSHQSVASDANETVWFAKHNIVGSLDFHSNLSVVMYPWAYTDEAPPPADVAKFKPLCDQLAQLTGYNSGMIADVFGIAQGSSADYWYWKNKTQSYGFEIEGDMEPDPSALPGIIQHNTEAIWQFIEHF
jgi:hypothetical protein